MLLQMLPAPVAFAASGSASQRGSTPISGVAIATPRVTAPVLSDALLPAWMQPEATQHEVTSGVVDNDAAALGESLLPNWMAPASVLAPQDAGQCPPEHQLALTLTPPPYAVSQGNAAGDLYTVTITNNGTISATEISLGVDPAGGFYYGGSAAATSNISGTLGLSNPGSTTPDATFSLRVTGAPPANALDPNETITFTFKLATTGDAVSGRSLWVHLWSGSPTTKTCKSATENVQTVRGNLVVSKNPTVQIGEVGDVITWTLTMRNTGLGEVYNARITDTIDSGYSNPQITQGAALIQRPSTIIQNGVNIPLLEPDQTMSYIVTGTLDACSNLSNNVEVVWPLGNEDGTATASHPYTTSTDVIPKLRIPDLTVEIGDLPQAQYCGDIQGAQVPVTITNSGGAAQKLRLLASAENLELGSASADWTYANGVFTYTGGAVPQAILSGETISFMMAVTTTTAVCDSHTASVSLTPRYKDACLFIEYTDDPTIRTVNMGVDAPTLEISKTSNHDGGFAVAGDDVYYTVVVTGTNITSTNGVVITDHVPSMLRNVNSGASGGTLVQSGHDITWT